jgi:protein-L-isoaspartate(D-aspartate) O-methyltransferase
MTLDEAFESVKRSDFLPEEQRRFAHDDRPLPIGYGQTNSQPTTVYRMLEWLQPELGNVVLDVGSGSGWTTALLSQLVGKTGKIYATEIVPELVDMGRENCADSGVSNVEFYQATDELGLKTKAPFDRILVSAGADQLPQILIDQLKSPGRMVIPVGDSILVLEKNDNGTITIREHYGYVFVPLIGAGDR